MEICLSTLLAMKSLSLSLQTHTHTHIKLINLMAILLPSLIHDTCKPYLHINQCIDDTFGCGHFHIHPFWILHDWFLLTFISWDPIIMKKIHKIWKNLENNKIIIIVCQHENIV